MDDSAVRCYKVIESYNEDVEVKSYDETKLFKQISMKIKQLVKRKISIFYLHFY